MKSQNCHHNTPYLSKIRSHFWNETILPHVKLHILVLECSKNNVSRWGGGKFDTYSNDVKMFLFSMGLTTYPCMWVPIQIFPKQNNSPIFSLRIHMVKGRRQVQRYEWGSTKRPWSFECAIKSMALLSLSS